MDISSEGVEDKKDSALERKLELLSSIDASESYPLRLLAQNSVAAFSSGVLSYNKANYPTQKHVSCRLVYSKSSLKN